MGGAVGVACDLLPRPPDGASGSGADGGTSACGCHAAGDGAGEDVLVGGLLCHRAGGTHCRVSHAHFGSAVHTG